MTLLVKYTDLYLYFTFISCTSYSLSWLVWTAIVLLFTTMALLPLLSLDVKMPCPIAARCCCQLLSPCTAVGFLVSGALDWTASPWGLPAVLGDVGLNSSLHRLWLTELLAPWTDQTSLRRAFAVLRLEFLVSSDSLGPNSGYCVLLLLVVGIVAVFYLE